MTAQQFLLLSEDPPGVRLELVEGEIAVSPSATPRHSYAAIQLIRVLADHIEANQLGKLLQDVDTILDRYTVRRPDVLYFSAERTHFIGEKAVEGPPDLAIEVISPSSTQIDRTDKFAQYAAAGVEYYWIVDPLSREIDAWRLERGQYAACGRGQGAAIVRLPPFPQLDIPLSRLWLE